jgi:DNA-binding MarR family transcriptional regulator
MQHQLLLAVRGHPDSRGPTISDVAGYLLVRHHSVVQLVDRAERAGLVRRVPDAADGRIVRLALSQEGTGRLEELAAATKEELSRMGSRLAGLWRGLQ